MKEVYIKTNMYDIFDKLGYKKDMVSIEDLLEMLEEQYYENQILMEKIDDLENIHEPDYYDAWQNQQLEEGVI